MLVFLLLLAHIILLELPAQRLLHRRHMTQLLLLLQKVRVVLLRRQQIVLLLLLFVIRSIPLAQQLLIQRLLVQITHKRIISSLLDPEAHGGRATLTAVAAGAPPLRAPQMHNRWSDLPSQIIPGVRPLIHGVVSPHVLGHYR